MTQTQDIRRHRDGPIDFDFYHARATALRAQAMRDAFKPKAFLRFTLITVAMVAAVVIAAFAPAHRVYCPYCTPTSETYMHSAADWDPFEGWEVTGWPRLTLSRGEIIVDTGKVLGQPGRGKLLKRKRFAETDARL